MKNATLATVGLLAVIGFWSCATVAPPPPSLYLESLPPTLVASLSLEERIAVEEAWSALREGRVAKAEKMFIKIGSESPASGLGLGYVYLLLNDFPSAETSFRRALEKNPDLTAAHLGLAQLYQKSGDEEKTFIELREVIKSEPDHPWAKKEYENLQAKITEELSAEAESYLKQGLTEKSKEAFLKILFYDPESVSANVSLAGVYKKENRLPDALLHLKAAASLAPKNRKILRDYAETLYESGQAGKSLEVYQQLLDQDPANKEAQARVEELKNKLGIYELPSQYNDVASAEAISREAVAALIAVKLKEVMTEAPAKPPIIVDITTSWASRFILKVTGLGILDVYDNHTFLPKKMVTRAEMAEILMRLINYLKQKGFKLIQQFDPEKIQISDVSPDNYYYQPITQVIAYGIMTLPPQKTFQPEEGLSGQDAIRIMDIIQALIK